MAKNDKRRIKQLANISEAEYAEIDKMIAEAVALKGQNKRVAMGRDIQEIPISGLGKARVYVFLWAVDNDVRGMIGWRAYGADEQVAAFQAQAAKYFSDGVKAKSVVMHCPDGHVERLR